MALCFIKSQLALAKQRYFLLKVFDPKALYKIMFLSIACLMIIMGFAFLHIQGRATKFYDEYRHSVLTYVIHIYIYNTYVHTYIHTYTYKFIYT